MSDQLERDLRTIRRAWDGRYVRVDEPLPEGFERVSGTALRCTRCRTFVTPLVMRRGIHVCPAEREEER